jgi:hypothetical protein
MSQSEAIHLIDDDGSVQQQVVQEDVLHDEAVEQQLEDVGGVEDVILEENTTSTKEAMEKEAPTEPVQVGGLIDASMIEANRMRLACRQSRSVKPILFRKPATPRTSKVASASKKDIALWHSFTVEMLRVGNPEKGFITNKADMFDAQMLIGRYRVTHWQSRVTMYLLVMSRLEMDAFEFIFGLEKKDHLLPLTYFEQADWQIPQLRRMEGYLLHSCMKIYKDAIKIEWEATTSRISKGNKGIDLPKCPTLAQFTKQVYEGRSILHKLWCGTKYCWARDVRQEAMAWAHAHLVQAASEKDFNDMLEAYCDEGRAHHLQCFHAKNHQSVITPLTLPPKKKTKPASKKRKKKAIQTTIDFKNKMVAKLPLHPPKRARVSPDKAEAAANATSDKPEAPRTVPAATKPLPVTKLSDKTQAPRTVPAATKPLPATKPTHGTATENFPSMPLGKPKTASAE